MSDAGHQQSEEAPEPVAPNRIKRNTACTSCRDAKVRCNPGLESRPCLRCAKLHLQCLVDKTHRRVSRKSKLEELVQEIQSIKKTVGNTSTSQPASNQRQHDTIFKESGPSPTIPSDMSRAGTLQTPGIAPSPDLHTPATTLSHGIVVEPSQSRALGSQPFSGEDIDFYFQKYFECYHPYMPIVRQRDPNKCYESGPLLFWTILFVASRKYATHPTVLPFLTNNVRREMYSAITNLPLSMPSIISFILVCTWIFPDVRFINDPSALFSSVAMNACLSCGIHTGKGAHPEYSFGVFQNSFTDEEASYAWAGYNVIAQRVSSYLGIPPLGGLFNQTVQNIIDGRVPFHVPPGFRVLLECQKFCNRVSKTVASYLEEFPGVSSHVIQMLEDEWDAVKGLICSDRADDLDRFNALLVQLEIQTYYLIPPRGYDSEAIKRNILRTYKTAQAVLRDALELNRKMDFLRHIPHFHFRAVTAAICVVYRLLHSSYVDFIDREDAHQSARDAITIAQCATVVEGDLPMRFGNLLGSWYELLQGNNRWRSEPVSSFCHRLGASVALDCVMTWKKDPLIASSRDHQRQQQQQRRQSDQPPSMPGMDATLGIEATPAPMGDGGSSSAGLNEPLLQNIDWGFLDDFDWCFEPNVLAT